MPPLKKQLPLEVLKALEPYVVSGSKLFRIEPDDKALLKFVDTDKSSEFCFVIRGYQNDRNNPLHLDIEFKPKNRKSTDFFKGKVDPTNLAQYFDVWTKCLQEYEETKAFDDPLLKQYEQEFETEIKILDPDADKSSYNYQTQLWIEQYLTEYTAILEKFKNEDNIQEVQTLQSEVEQLRKEQTRITKKEFIAKLVTIWAKTRKLAMSLVKDVYETTKKEIIKRLISGQLDDLIQ